MGQTGAFSWDIYKREKNVWLSAREVGSGDNLKASLREVGPPIGGGVPVGSGFYHQATRASPKAPTGATARSVLQVEFQPQLDEDTNRHVEACWHASEFGAAELWMPWPWRDSWKITGSRTKYSVPGRISGSAASWPGLHYEPIVEVRELTGELDTALAFAASGPSSSEFTLTNTTADQTFITTGDLSAKDGKMLMIWYWGVMEIVIRNFEQGWDGANNWTQVLEFEVAPSPRDYEADS